MISLEIIACIMLVPTSQPNSVVLMDDGSIQIQYVSIFDAVHGSQQQRPHSVPLYEAEIGGATHPGVWYSGLSGTGNHAHTYPGALVEQSDGSWLLEYYTWRTYHGPRIFNQRPILGSETLEIIYFDGYVENKNTEIGGITWIYDDDGEREDLDGGEVARSITRALAVYLHLFQGDDVFGRFRFEWESVGGSVLAFAETVESARSYSEIRGALTATYDANDSDTFENKYQNNYPLGNNISYARDINSSDQTNSIKLVWPIRNSILGGSAYPDQLRIVINSDYEFWEPDPARLSVFAGKTDMTGVLVHELGHHFGFGSNLELLDLNFLEDSITIWDIFRLNESAVGGSVSTTEFRTQTRELRTETGAVATLDINSSIWIPSLAHGEFGDDSSPAYGQASHWSDSDPGNTDYIGIMDPRVGGGSLLSNGRYLTLNDIRAFDAMGYNIDYSDFITPPGDAMPIEPVSDEEVALDAPLLIDWSDDSSTEFSDLLIYDLGTTITQTTRGPTPTLAYRQNDISADSVTLSSMEFDKLPGHRYEWFVVAYNPQGYSRTESETFVVDCPPDVNDDGNLDFFDTSMVTSGMFDYNGDTVFDFFDISAFLDDFSAGCP